ncbi:DUF1659 domain-containing protein [Lysinibacillus sphaericus]|uniref:DUF1659 domain-containing protein n=1 Tax=Lysinibacillus sphaericus TaxID=1421 RepID=UPI001E4C70DB|nr:DUF1659 domain-containing protein [Lysinibacillus sphaericus]UDK96570.1 DUF1659 domain-containing protein [Lysinibacillus sphaericus]
MAKTHLLDASLRLKYVVGHTETNKPKFVIKTYRNVNDTHTPTALVTVAKAIASLSSKPLDSISKQEITELSSLQ